jgi:hypothetical protein
LLALLVAAGVGLSVVSNRWLRRAPPKPQPGSVAPGATSETAPPPIVDKLPEEIRSRLWNIEHRAFVVERKWFPQIAAALRARDRDALARWLARDARVVPVPESPAEQVENRLATVRYYAAGDPVSTRDGRDSCVDALLAYRDLLVQIDGVSLGLARLSPTLPDDLDKPWDCRVKIRMWGRSASGPAELTLYGEWRLDRVAEELAAYADTIRHMHFTSALVTHGRDFLFREMAAAETGIDSAGLQDNWTCDARRRRLVTGGLYCADFDGDADVDLLVTDIGKHWLYRQRAAGLFEDATEALGLPGWCHGPPIACWADLDNDGWTDLVLGDRVYQNLAGRQFVDRTSETDFRLPPLAQNVTVADYDRDGFVDLFVVAAAPVPPRGIAGQSERRSSFIDDRTGVGNRLWRNLGSWRFLDVTDRAQARGDGGSSFAAVWSDANRDGWPDVAVANELGPNWLMLGGPDGRFRTRVLDADSPRFAMGVTAGDYDNDRYADLYFAAMYSKAGQRIMANLPRDIYAPATYRRMDGFVAGSPLYHNPGAAGGGGEVGAARRVADPGWAYGSGFMDLDNDGWLDLYALAGFQSVDRSKPDG